MGYMQAYRVGNSQGEAPLGKISRLLTGEGIDCDDLGDSQPENGCVLIDFTSGEELVHQTREKVPQLPQVLVASTQTLGFRQLDLADDFVSPDMPDAEIIRRVECLTNAAIRMVEEVPDAGGPRVLLDGGTDEEGPLRSLAELLTENEIEWEALENENDMEGTGLIYTHYRRASYSRLLQGDFPGYLHIQMTLTPELREEALGVGDFSYVTPKIAADEVVPRHAKFLQMLGRLRDRDAQRAASDAGSDVIDVLFVGDRNVGNNLKSGMGDDVNLSTMASTAGGMAQAQKHELVLIHLGSKEDEKERLAFLQRLIKNPDRPELALLFLKEAPDQLRSLCEKNNVAIIESKNATEVKNAIVDLFEEVEPD